MYLRPTTRKNKNGSSVQYFQLAHNEWDSIEKVSKPKIIHNFGRADQLNKEALERLCHSIAKVCGLKIAEKNQASNSKAPSAGLPEGLEQYDSLPLGPIHVLESVWKRLKIKEILCNFRDDQRQLPFERAIFAMVANRLCEPESKLGIWDRWLNEVFLPSCWNLKLDYMYESMDILQENIEKVEKAIFFQTANLFNLEVDLIYYDTTVATFSIDNEDDEPPELRKYGRKKNGAWNIQIVVALAITKDGLPVRSWIFPGNTADSSTIERIRSDLRDWQLGRILFVSDSGMNSDENRKILSRGCGKYLLACKLSGIAEIRDEVLSKAGRYHEFEENLFAKEVVIGEGERRRRYFLCYNPREAFRQKTHRENIVKELEEKIAKHPENNATAKWALELLTSGRYKRYLTSDKGFIKINRAAVKKAERYDGKWVLQTNDDSLTLEDGAYGYKNLTIIEQCFRSLKSGQINLMPMNHRLPQRIEAHVKICVLALLLERSVEILTNKNWSDMFRILKKIQATKYKSETHEFFQVNEISIEAKNLLKKLDIPLPKKVLELKNL